MLKFCTFILRKNQLKPYYHQYLFIILLFLPLAVVRAQDGSSSSSPNPFHTLGIVLLAVLAFSGYIVLYLFFKHCVMPWASRRVERLAHAGLDSSVLKTLPVFAYSNMAGFLPNKGPVECSVCLGLFEEDERLRLLPKCGHVFHVDCVDPWLAGHSTCPLCRADLVPKPEEVTEVDSGCVTVDLEGGEEEVNVGANNDVVEVVRGEIQLMQGGQSGKIWRWNSTGHVARCEGVSEEQRSTVSESNIGSRELDRSKSCIIIKLD